MRRIPTACRSALSVAVVAVVLSGCSGSDENSSAAGSSSSSSSASPSSAAPSADSEFCTRAGSIQQRVASTFTESDPADLGALLQEGAAEVRETEPPAEIAADWVALADGLEQVAAAFAGVDLNDPDAQQALGRKVAELQGPLNAASTNVENYLRDECGLQIGSTGTAAPTS
jgi:ABC-type glycerol-3-phosphate transport system substrate-binding protein